MRNKGKRETQVGQPKGSGSSCHQPEDGLRALRCPGNVHSRPVLSPLDQFCGGLFHREETRLLLAAIWLLACCAHSWPFHSLQAVPLQRE